MKPAALWIVAAFALAVPAAAEDVPFADPSARPGQTDTSLLPGLGDIMNVTQTRHIKLWYAGKSANWPLVTYQLDRIRESLVKAATLYVNIPVEYISMVNQPLSELREAAKAGNAETFNRGYAALTAACNSCHEAGQVPFIRIQTPIASPFSNEAFGPQRR